MHSRTSITILVWVAVLCSTRVVSYKMNILEKSELANKLNVLVHHSGWQFMNDVKILEKKRGEPVDPVSEILAVISLNQKPVDASNVQERHKQIWTVLMCKYSEIIYHYKVFTHNLIQVCQYDKKLYRTYQQYYDCFDSLLNKLSSMSPRFKCMMDALVFINSLVPKSKSKHSTMVAAEILAEYTLTLRTTIESKLSEPGIKVVDVVDHEIKAIGDHIQGVYKKFVKGFIFDYCSVPRDKKWTNHTMIGDFMYLNQHVLQETSMLQFAENQIDLYVEETFLNWFYNLGFGYDEDANVVIRPVENIIGTEIPIYSVDNM